MLQIFVQAKGAPMTSVDSREGSPPATSAIDRKSERGRQASKDMSIVLIDRRPLTRQCLSQWLQDGLWDLPVVSVGSPSDLLDASRSFSDPHMIIFSIGAASVRAPEVLSKITLLRRHMGRIPLVLLSDRDDVDEIVEAIELGARGYIPTSMEGSEAAAAIHCVEAGGTFVPANALIKFAQDRQHASQRDPRDLDTKPFATLTPRETDVLARLRQGKPNKVIAHELEISESTVKVFVRRILIKLRASNRTEVAYLLRGQTEPA
jgi:DNA-binding NarL/FixJ family response regulator